MAMRGGRGTARRVEPGVVVGVALGVEDDPVGLEPDAEPTVLVDLRGDPRAGREAVAVVRRRGFASPFSGPLTVQKESHVTRLWAL